MSCNLQCVNLCPVTFYVHHHVPTHVLPGAMSCAPPYAHSCSATWHVIRPTICPLMFCQVLCRVTHTCAHLQYVLPGAMSCAPPCAHSLSARCHVMCPTMYPLMPCQVPCHVPHHLPTHVLPGAMSCDPQMCPLMFCQVLCRVTHTCAQSCSARCYVV